MHWRQRASYDSRSSLGLLCTIIAYTACIATVDLSTRASETAYQRVYKRVGIVRGVLSRCSSVCGSSRSKLVVCTVERVNNTTGMKV